MICDRCGEDKEGVIEVVDPYIFAMSGESYLIKLCDECYNDKIQSI